MNNFFDNLDFSETLSQIRDKGGLKIVDVYTYRKSASGNPQIMPFLPTPQVDFITKDEILEPGGVISFGDVILKQIPISRYSEEDLQTISSEPGVNRYWLLDSRKSEPKAYTTAKISRGTIFWEVLLTPYKPLDSDDIKKLLEGLNG